MVSFAYLYDAVDGFLSGCSKADLPAEGILTTNGRRVSICVIWDVQDDDACCLKCVKMAGPLLNLPFKKKRLNLILYFLLFAFFRRE
jgi:hypothetical protein